jgi:hypothetical protein
MRRYKRVIGNTLESRNDTFKSLDCMGDLGRALCSRVAQLISRRRRCAPSSALSNNAAQPAQGNHSSTTRVDLFWC